MSDARSLTPLSETDYDAIADAVMETARGRWFMAEFARRNRQADTGQLLGAIGRIEKALGLKAMPEVDPRPLQEATALVMDLRADLERVGGTAGTGLAARMEGSAGKVLTATEAIQEAAWGLREAGADSGLCDRLDRSATEIYIAGAVLEAAARQIAKIGDTVAMLDSSLRAYGEPLDCVTDLLEPAPPATAAAPLQQQDVATLGGDDIAVVEIDDSHGRIDALAQRLEPAQPLVEDDLDFADAELLEDAAAAPPPAPAFSEERMRSLDAMSPAEKLRYFA